MKQNEINNKIIICIKDGVDFFRLQAFIDKYFKNLQSFHWGPISEQFFTHGRFRAGHQKTAVDGLCILSNGSGQYNLQSVWSANHDYTDPICRAVTMQEIENNPEEIVNWLATPLEEYMEAS